MSYFFKRIMDIIISLAGLVLISPLLLIVALAIKFDSPGPVFYRQERVGKDCRLFHIFKFRTMVVGAENKGAGVFVKENDPRITRVGKFLRHYSLDELPQLFNVVRGEMSLVGPRPTLLYQVERYDQRQLQRLNMKPGVTGWAQVHGRSALNWPERIELDLWYIKNQSRWIDIKVLFKTLMVIFSNRGLYREGKDDPISGNFNHDS